MSNRSYSDKLTQFFPFCFSFSFFPSDSLYYGLLRLEEGEEFFLVIKAGRRVSTLYLDKFVCLCVCVFVCVYASSLFALKTQLPC